MSVLSAYIGILAIKARIGIGLRYKMIENFVPKDADHVKGLPRGNRVDQDVAMNANEML